MTPTDNPSGFPASPAKPASIIAVDPGDALAVRRLYKVTLISRTPASGPLAKLSDAVAVQPCVFPSFCSSDEVGEMLEVTDAFDPTAEMVIEEPAIETLLLLPLSE